MGHSVQARKREKKRKREKEKKREKARKMEMEKNQDRISHLSNDILCKILSFLPTKMVVASSILAKRWKNVWAGVQVISLSSDGFTGDFRSTVDMLLNKVSAQCIRQFSLDFKPMQEIEELQLSSWITDVVKHGVEELNLSFCVSQGPAMRLPDCLFACKTMVSLKLYDDTIIDIPAKVCFPALRTLQLERVVYANEGCLKRLTSNCPILEELILVRTMDDGIIVLDNGYSLDINVRSLKRLVVKKVTNSAIDAYKVYVDAPLLERIELSDENISNFQLQHQSNLREAIIDVTVLSHPDDDDAIGWFADVEILCLSEVAFMSYDARFPVFRKLIRLEISTSCEHWVSLVRLFHHSKKLKTLIYHELSRSDHSVYEVCVNWFLKTDLKVWKSLTTVKVTGFINQECSQRLIAHILQKAKRLKKMEIGVSSLVKKCRHNSLRNLLNYPRVSQECQIRLFEDSTGKEFRV